MGSQTSSPDLRFTQEDLKDPNLSRFNRVFAMMFGQVSKLTGSSGPVSILNTLTAKNITLDQPGPPSDPNTVMTRGSCDTLYSVEVVRRALISSVPPPTEQPIQPISTGSGTYVPPNPFIITGYGVPAQFIGVREDGTSTHPTPPLLNEPIAEFGAEAWNGSAVTSDLTAGMFIYAAEVWGAAANGSYVQIEATQPGHTARSAAFRVTYSAAGIGQNIVTNGGPVVSSVLDVSTGVNQHLVVFPYTSGLLGGGVVIGSVQDNGTSLAGMDIQGSVYLFQGNTSGVGDYGLVGMQYGLQVGANATTDPGPNNAAVSGNIAAGYSAPPRSVTSGEVNASRSLSVGTSTDPGAKNVDIAGVYKVSGLQVVSVQMPAITPPSGGTTIDAQARTAINSILAVLSLGSGGHGLTA